MKRRLVKTSSMSCSTAPMVRAGGVSLEAGGFAQETRPRQKRAEAVDLRAGKDREKIQQAGERADQGTGELRAEPDLLGEVNREHRFGAVEGEAFEEFERVGDPEGAMEAASQLSEAVGQGHNRLKYSGRRRAARRVSHVYRSGAIRF